MPPATRSTKHQLHVIIVLSMYSQPTGAFNQERVIRCHLYVTVLRIDLCHPSICQVNSYRVVTIPTESSPCPSYKLTVDKLAYYSINFYRDSDVFHTPAWGKDCACIKGFPVACLFVSCGSHKYVISGIWWTGIWSTSTGYVTSYHTIFDRIMLDATFYHHFVTVVTI